MISDTILHKYLRQFRLMDGTRFYHIDAIELAFRLALDELAESIPSTADTTADENLIAAQGRRIMELQADLERLQTATDTNNAALTDQIAQLDADNAALIRRNKELTEELKQARLDVQETAFHANGNGMLITGGMTPNKHIPDTPIWEQPQAIELLPTDIRDYWDGIAAGRWTWRRLPKPVRLAMVRHVLSFGPEDGAMTMAEFDAVRPEWMPAAQSLPTTFGCSWPDLNDLRKEIEVHS